MTVLFDTNVVLDVLLDRVPFAETALLLFHRVERKSIQGDLCATTLTDIYYIARPAVGKETALNRICELLDLFEIASVDRSILKTAADGDFLDFEDAVLYESAKRIDIDAIVTRNRDDFEKSDIPVYSPDDLNALLDLQADDN
ncbi:MAG: PIN domain-containing protein [Candidatus Latescibacteria bacterium]|nr:PIN domain-containing protein [Candidatus Latescibacterota bacterium]